MNKKGITAHMIVKNEEYWIWYAIQSILKQVDAVLIFDTGSTDKTQEIVNTIRSKKIIFEAKGKMSREGLVKLRNEMVKRTKTDWFVLVDGDEIWPGYALTKLSDAIQDASEETWGLVLRTRNCVADVWHYQPESAGRYKLLGRKGHLTIRAYKNLPGFSWKGKYPNEAYSDPDGKPIHEQEKHLKFLDVAYWHLTHLPRSSRSKDVIDRPQKHKLELGIKAKKEELPEVFFIDRPSNIPSPWVGLSPFEKLKAATLTPMRTIKRMIKK